MEPADRIGMADSKQAEGSQRYEKKSKRQNIMSHQASSEYDSDASGNQVVQHRSRPKKMAKTRACMNFFSSCGIGWKNEAQKEKNYHYSMGQFGKVKILSTSETSFEGSSAQSNLKVIRTLGMVDTTIYRRIYLEKDHASLESSSYGNNKNITQCIENSIRDLNEIMRSKVAAINGNCIPGYNTDVFKLKEEYTYNQAILLGMTATGDAVELAVLKDGTESEQQQETRVQRAASGLL